MECCKLSPGTLFYLMALFALSISYHISEADCNGAPCTFVAYLGNGAHFPVKAWKVKR